MTLFKVDVSLCVFSAIIFYIFGYYFSYSQLSYRSRAKSLVIHFSFASTTSFSCLIFQFLIFEILNICEPDFRHTSWKFSIVMLLIFLLVINPLIFNFYLVDSLNSIKRTPIKVKIVIIFFFWVTFLYFIWILPSFLPGSSFYHSTFFEQVLNRISIIGVLLTAIFSGFASVIYPYDYLKHISTDLLFQRIYACKNFLNPYSNSTVLPKAEDSSINQYPSDSINSMSLDNQTTSRIRRPFSSSLNTLSQGSTSSSEPDNSLKDLKEELPVSYYDLSSEAHPSQKSKWGIRYNNFMTIFLTLYCIWRILSTSSSLILGNSSTTDPVTVIVEMAIHLISPKLDSLFWSQSISFLFVGGMAFSSVKSILFILSRLYPIFSSHKRSHLIVLILAEITGFNLLSCVVLLRTSLPPSYRSVLTSLLGDLNFDIYDKFFDIIYLISSILTISFLWSIRKRRRFAQ